MKSSCQVPGSRCRVLIWVQQWRLHFKKPDTWNLTPGTFSPCRGMTLIEVLVATAIMLVVFVGFFNAYIVAASGTASAKAKSVALRLVSSNVELIRSLPYASVGIVGGAPAGVLVGSEIKYVNGAPYTQTTSVAYVDDPANGIGSNDYKVVQSVVTWIFRGASRNITITTYVAP